MAKIRLPGVYFEDNPKIERGLSLGETGVPAFLGVAERGPLNEPVSVQSMHQFLRIFGEPVPNSYLHASVWGFFANGGARCFVVRVAHVFRNGKGELARCSRYELLDKSGYPTLEVKASSEGNWGNKVSVRVEYSDTPRVHTFLTFDLAAGSRMATVQSSRGMERGMLLRLRDGESSRYVTLDRIRGNEIYWRDAIDREFKSAAPTYLESIEFDLLVKEKTRSEKFSNLSMCRMAVRNVSRIVAQESELVRVNVLSGGEFEHYPDKTDDILLRGGRDGLSGITSDDVIGYNSGPDSRFGLGALESNEEIDLVCVPDLQYFRDYCEAFKSDRDFLGVQQAVVDHCERFGDRFAILETPRDMKIEQVQDYRAKFHTSFAALYYPWCIRLNGDREEVVPPCGFMAGVYAKCDRTDGVFRAPANVPIEGLSGLKVVLHEGHLSELNDKGICCIRFVPQRGIRPWGARSLSNEPDWRYLTSRRVFNAVRRAIYENTQWVVFEVNGADLRHSVTLLLTDFLGKLWAAGYFPGKVQEAAFFVQCDANNNSHEDNDAGTFHVDVGIAIGKPMEYIVMSFEHKMEEQVVGV
ncbi:MAG: phage tail sheath subtilisin-like domain-containing protein [Proteobacteria bacterium]|nr:phage tail sheath subtilisin-like domain-containing protein [Pseudomonadota bacterium]